MSNNWIPQEFAPTNSNLKNVFMLIVLVSTFVLTLLLSQFNKKNVQTVEITKLGIESKTLFISLASGFKLYNLYAMFKSPNQLKHIHPMPCLRF